MEYQRYLSKSDHEFLCFSQAKNDTFCKAIYDTCISYFSSTSELVTLQSDSAHEGEIVFDCHTQSGDRSEKSDDDSNNFGMCKVSAQHIDSHDDVSSYELEPYSESFHMDMGIDCKEVK